MSARGLAEAGVEVVFIAASGERDAMLSHPKIDFRGLKLPEIAGMPGKERIRASIWRTDAVTPLLAAVSEFAKPGEVVHVHCYRDNFSAAGLHAILGLPCRTIVTAHDYRLGCPVGDFYNACSQAVCQLKGGSLPCWLAPCHSGGPAPKLLSNVRFGLAKRRGVPGRVREVVFVSEFQRSRLSGYLPMARHYTLGNPVEFVKSPAADLNRNRGLVFVGRLQAGKDPVSAARVSKELGCPITFVGEGELRDAVLDSCPHAEVLGWVTPEVVRETILGSRVHLFPARWYETQGLSVLEATANGVPTVCLETCAASETVKQYGGGLVVPAGNHAAFVEATRRMLGPEGVEAGLAAYELFWKEPPDLAWHAQRTMEIYAGS
jgi:glycosyltransferase involved in cell wall biosynthesis